MVQFWTSEQMFCKVETAEILVCAQSFLEKVGREADVGLEYNAQLEVSTQCSCSKHRSIASRSVQCSFH